MIDDAERTLVVILAAALALLLALSILAVVKFMQLLNTLRSVAEKAEYVAEAAETLTNSLPKAFGSLAIGRIFAKAFNAMMNKSFTGKKGK